MAKLIIHAINKIADISPEGKIIADYLKRLPWQVEIKQFELKEKLPSEKQKMQEGLLLLKQIQANDFLIALDERGQQFSSPEFANFLFKIEKPIYFIIGGANGLSEEVKNRANILISLSKLTMPHALARIVLIEQIYRSFTIMQGHPYHK